MRPRDEESGGRGCPQKACRSPILEPVAGRSGGRMCLWSKGMGAEYAPRIKQWGQNAPPLII